MLRPETVPQLAGAMGQAIELLLQQQFVREKVDLYLTAADRGSLRLAFKAVVRHTSDEKVVKSVETLKGITEALTLAIGGVVAIGVYMGVLKPIDDKAERQPAGVIELADQAKDERSIRSAIDNIVKVVEDSGAAYILVRVPEAPSCTVSFENRHRNEFLGLYGVDHSNLYKEAKGALHFTGKSLKVRLTDTNETATLYEGILNSEGGFIFKAAVLWRSKKKLDLADRFEIVGATRAFENIEPLEPVGNWARESQGLLVVSATVTYE